jgi:Bacterial TSP3 repeat
MNVPPASIIFRIYSLLAALLTCVSCQVARAQTVPDSLWIKESAVLQWDFEDGSTDGWTVASSSVANLRSETGCLRGDSVGNDANVTVSGQRLQLRDAAGVAVRVWFSQAATLALSWSNEDGGFSETRSVQQVVPAQQWTTVRFNLAANSQWAGKTQQALRIDPGDVAGMSFAIDYMAVLDRIEDRDGSLTTQTYDFNADAQSWGTASPHVSGFRWEEGKLKGSSTGNDPYITSPAISVANLGGVAVQVKSSVTTQFAISWTTTEGGFSSTRTAALPVTNAGWQTLYFDLRANPRWAGKTITGLRLDPGAVTGQNFEIDSVVLLKPQAFEDADGDGLLTFVETLNLSNPATRSTLRGRLPIETWSPMNHYSTRSLVTDGSFYAPATSRTTLLESTTGRQPALLMATRLRGYIVAPTTGDYRFWVSGRNGVELSLSDDATKYRKRRIAEINPDLGDGHGIQFGSTNLWDQSAAQMSEPIPLVQGQLYFFETLQAQGHGGNGQVSLAWAPPGEGRARIPSACLHFYTQEAADADDDYLPDAWETQYGLNVLDNGRIDLARQGERGDFDSDGLANREEYLLGTDPSNADTDGDGVSDGLEVNSLGSNALVANVNTDTLLSAISLADYTSSSTAWTMTSGGLLANSFRGEATWNFSVPSDGHWLLRLDLELMGATYGNEEVPVVIRVDGKIVARRHVQFGSGKLGLMQALSPWLLAGTHQVSVLVDNTLARRTVRLVGLKIYSSANPNAILAQGNRVLSRPATTRTSPGFIEGYARDASSVTVNGVPAAPGTSAGHWFTNVPLLNQSSVQAHTIRYEQGWEATGTFTWQATNVMDAEFLTVRLGDALRLGAWGTDPTLPATLTFSSGGSTTLIGQETTTRTFSSAGTFTVTGRLQSGASATLTVKVIAPPTFPLGTVDALDAAVRSLSVASATEVAFDAPTDFCRLIVSRSGTSARLGILPNLPEELGVAARLFTGGPILSVQRVNVIGVSDALQNDLSSVSSGNLAGYKLIRTPLTVLNLPPGGRVDVSIFRAGVLFPNGTTRKSIYPADLENGSVTLEFLYPLGQPGGYCHNLTVYDRNGFYLGTR